MPTNMISNTNLEIKSNILVQYLRSPGTYLNIWQCSEHGSTTSGIQYLTHSTTHTGSTFINLLSSNPYGHLSTNIRDATPNYTRYHLTLRLMEVHFIWIWLIYHFSNVSTTMLNPQVAVSTLRVSPSIIKHIINHY